MKISTPSHFFTLGCEPFWSLNRDDEALLKAHVIKLGRRFHPDLLGLDASDEEREKAEAQSSAINSAFLKLRDQETRCDYIMNEAEAHDPAQFSLKSKVALPLELSMTYFELQDSIVEGNISEGVRNEINDFSAQLRSIFEEEKLKLNKALTRMQTPLTLNDSPSKNWDLDLEGLKHIAEIRGLQKYLDRILIDIRKYQ